MQDDDRRDFSGEWHRLLPEDWETVKKELEDMVRDSMLPGTRDSSPRISPLRIAPFTPPERAYPCEWREPCAIEAYFRQHPHETSVMMVCFCPRCSPRF